MLPNGYPDPSMPHGPPVHHFPGPQNLPTMGMYNMQGHGAAPNPSAVPMAHPMTPQSSMPPHTATRTPTPGRAYSMPNIGHHNHYGHPVHFAPTASPGNSADFGYHQHDQSTRPGLPHSAGEVEVPPTQALPANYSPYAYDEGRSPLENGDGQQDMNRFVRHDTGPTGNASNFSNAGYPAMTQPTQQQSSRQDGHDYSKNPGNPSRPDSAFSDPSATDLAGMTAIAETPNGAAWGHCATDNSGVTETNEQFSSPDHSRPYGGSSYLGSDSLEIPGATQNHMPNSEENAWHFAPPEYPQSYAGGQAGTFPSMSLYSMTQNSQ